MRYGEREFISIDALKKVLSQKEMRNVTGGKNECMGLSCDSCYTCSCVNGVGTWKQCTDDEHVVGDWACDQGGADCW